MVTVILAAGFLLVSVALYESAFKFTIDAGPVGSMMLAASIVSFAVSLFMFGVVVGHMTA